MLKVIGIGELLWDILPDGKKPGGAPCNFVYHAQQLGAKAIPITAIGNDSNGNEILDWIKHKGISTDLIQRNNFLTGTVDVVLDAKGVPAYTINENVAWDHIAFNEKIKNEVANADIFAFGSLAQRGAESRKTIEKILESACNDALILFDVNLRQQYYNREIIDHSLKAANILKLNEEELPIIAALLNISEYTEERQLRALLDRYALKLIALTKGGKGSTLMTANEKSYLDTPNVAVKDTIGAGDAFSAAMVMGFAEGKMLTEIHKKAIEIAGFVCSKEGAMPNYNEN